MTPKQILSTIFTFAKANKKIILYLAGGLAATGVVVGAIMLTSGPVLKGALFLIPQNILPPKIESCVTDPSSPITGLPMKYVLTISNFNSTDYKTIWILPDKPTINKTDDTYLEVSYSAAGSYSVTAEIHRKSDNSIIDEKTCYATVKNLTLPPPSIFPECASYSYTEWGPCVNGSQSRRILSSSPSDCVGGVQPVLTQSCVPTPPACTSFNYSDWGSCSNGSQTRSVISTVPANCTGGETPILKQSCTTPTPTQTQTPASTSTQTQTPAPTPTQTQTPAPTPQEAQETVPTACTGKDILSCHLMSNTLYLSDKIPIRINCALTDNGIVSAQVIKGALTDPNKPQSDSAIIKKLLDNQPYSASKSKPKGFYMLFDGLDSYDMPVEDGEYTILTTARLSQNSAPDCSVQKFKVISERPRTAISTTKETSANESSTQTLLNEPTGTKSSQTANSTGTMAEQPTVSAAEPKPEPSKCPGINYPKDIAGHWAENFIKQAYDDCIFKGYDDGTFRPDRNITRAEALKTILNAVGVKPILGCYDADCGSPFMDLEMWQGPWVRAAWNLKIINDANKFRPNNLLTRAEAAMMIAKAFIKLGKSSIPMRVDCFTPNCGAGYPNNFFMDIKDFWQGPAIRWLWDNGLTQGRGPGTFAPNDPITRAELTKLVMQAAARK
jgi:hypothetical protein